MGAIMVIPSSITNTRHNTNADNENYRLRGGSINTPETPSYSENIKSIINSIYLIEMYMHNY